MTSKRAVAVALVGFLGLGSVVAYGQGNSPGMPDVLGNILTAVKGVQSDVTSILAKLNAPPPAESNVVLVGPLGLTANGVECTFLNVASASRTVNFEVLNSSGTVVFAPALTPTVQSGHATGIVLTDPTLNSLAYCRFTVTNGTKSDIRATIQTAGGALSTP